MGTRGLVQLELYGLPTISIRCAGFRATYLVRGVLSTGNAQTLVSRTILNGIGAFQKGSVIRRTVSGTSLFMQWGLEIALPWCDERGTMAVLEHDGGCNRDLILGRDFLHTFGLWFEFKNGYLRMRHYPRNRYPLTARDPNFVGETVVPTQKSARRASQTGTHDGRVSSVRELELGGVQEPGRVRRSAGQVDLPRVDRRGRRLTPRVD